MQPERNLAELLHRAGTAAGNEAVRERLGPGGHRIDLVWLRRRSLVAVFEVIGDAAICMATSDKVWPP